MVAMMSYFQDEELEAVKTEAKCRAARSDDLWSFIHSTFMDIMNNQGAELGSYRDEWAKGTDGIYKMKDGTFDVNVAAEHMQVALEVRDEFMRDRASNDKSG